MLLATGISYRKLDVPGADELTGRGLFYGSAATEAPACAGDEVFIVGGANSAGQAAVFFARHARRVTMLVRATSLEASMSHYLVQQIAETPTIDVRLDSEVTAVEGDEPPRSADRPQPQQWQRRDGEGGPPVRVHRCRPAHGVARRCGGTRLRGASCSPVPT